MTPVEQPHLPQLSLQRYVDLVKRRRWQVLPVSLLGLLVGGIVAFFIPRCLATLIAQAFSQDHFAEWNSMLWAAS